MLINPERHRRRRDVVKTMFSLKTCEQQLAPEIQRIVARAIKKMTEAHESKKPLDMTQIFRMMSADTIMKILFDMDMNLIESDEIEPPYIATMKMFAGNFLFMKQFPFLAAIAINMPHAIAHKLVPGYTRFREQCEGWIDTIAKRQEKGDHFGDDKYTTYFDLLLGSQKSEKAERFTKEVLVDEAVAMCFAGTDTSSYALHFGTYYLLSNPAALTTLLEELKDVPTNDDGIIEYRDVANLPYFSAVIKEILRMACPVPGILPRKVPAAGSEACGYYLAPGTTVSQSIRMIHYNPEIFAEPNTFMPERWLGPDASELNKWFLAFSKGPRACIGPNIANIEMHIVFANIFKRFNMSVYGDAANVTNYRDSAAARIWQNLEVTVDSVK
jgi:cytochrome P450